MSPRPEDFDPFGDEAAKSATIQSVLGQGAVVVPMTAVTLAVVYHGRLIAEALFGGATGLAGWLWALAKAGNGKIRLSVYSGAYWLAGWLPGPKYFTLRFSSFRTFWLAG